MRRIAGVSFMTFFMTIFAASLVRAQSRATPDSANIARFTDQFLHSLHGGDSVARGAIVIADPERLVVARGIGMTASGRPVDPESSVFRAASNSKLFVAVAVMQLVRKGQLDLTGDVNRYLPAGARLSDAFDRPVTLADLLTHTAGLDSKFEGSIASVGHRSTLEQYFTHHVPARVMPPGQEIAYSNTGMALAGYVVERIARVSFERYAEQNVFAPLGMARSSFGQPPPRAIASALAGGSPRADRIVVFNPYPAASLVTTPNDMARFVQSQLSHGGAALDSVGTALMQSSHWRAAPNAPAAAYGFFEGERAGQRYLFHTGDSGDHSLILLLPSAHIGLYFVYSGTDEQSGLRERLAGEFLDRFAGPRDARITGDPPTARLSVSRLAGRYRAAAFSRTNYEKVRSALLQLRVADQPDGTLIVMPPGTAPGVRLHSVGGRTFVGDSGEVVAFRYGPGGDVRGFTLTGSVWDPSSWDRIGWYQSSGFLITMLAIWLGAALVRAVVAPPLLWLLERRGVSPRPRRLASRAWRWTGVGAWITLAAPVIGFARAMTSFRIPAEALTAGAHAAGIAIIIGTAISLASAWNLARSTGVQRWLRIAASGLAAASGVGISLVLYWRLLPL